MLCTTCSVNNDITNSVDVMKRIACILAQFELRDINNGPFTDVFEIKHVFVEVKDSQELRLVRLDSPRRHWADSPVVAMLVIHITCNGDFYSLEPFVRIAQRLRDDVCVLMPKCVG